VTPAPTTSAVFVHRHRDIIQGFQKAGLGYGHAEQVLTLLGGGRGLILMDPGALVADIGHLKEILVQTGVSEHILEGGLMSAGRAGRHHHPVEMVLFDHLHHLALGVLGAGEQICLGIENVDGFSEAESLVEYIR
jgi:hypothetical protein